MKHRLKTDSLIRGISLKTFRKARKDGIPKKQSYWIVVLLHGFPSFRNLAQGKLTGNSFSWAMLKS
jgi:hypothetical protein